MSKIIKIALIWSLGIVALSYLGTYVFAPFANSSPAFEAPNKRINFYLALAQWDGGNYLHIAKNGYDDGKLVAFAPLYPLVIMFFSWVLPSPIIAGVLISHVSFLIFIFFFYKYLILHWGKRVANNTIITLIFFPTAFFLILVYSEALFLMLVVLSLYAFDQKRPIMAAIFGGTSSLARYLGVFLIVSIVAGAIRKKQNLKSLIVYFSANLPLLIFSTLLFVTYHNPFLYLSAEANWHRHIQNPFFTIEGYLLQVLFKPDFSQNNTYDVIVTLTFLVLLVAKIKKIPFSLWTFSAFAILIPASTGTLTSMPRYALASLGSFVAIGLLIDQNKWLKYIVWPAMLMAQGVIISLFITGHWIA